MNRYEYDIKLFGGVALEVCAESKEEATQMVKNLCNELSIYLDEEKFKNVKVVKENIETKFAERNKERGEER